MSSTLSASEQVTNIAEHLDAERKAADFATTRRAIEFLVDIAVRELTLSSRPTDGEDLIQILIELDWNLERYREVLSMIRQVGHRAQRRDEFEQIIKDQRTDVLRIELARVTRRYELDSRRLTMQLHAAERAEAAVADYEYDLDKLTSPLRDVLFEGGKLLPAIASYRAEPVPKAEPINRVCKFCGGTWTAYAAPGDNHSNNTAHVDDGEFCSYKCQSHQEQLQAIEAKIKQA